MKKVFRFYSDPQHGWLAVPVKELMTLGLSGKISRFSYMQDETIFLEEDLDAGLFIETYTKLMGFKPVIRHSWTNRQSKIRGYASYNPVHALQMDIARRERG